jgi:hypothetical protein
VYVFSHTEYSEFSSCTGKVKLRTTILKIFVSKKGNYIGVSKEGILIFLNDYPVFSGDTVLIYGRAQKLNSTCWIFPDKVIVID